jgi:excisionase family DNA binding protein
MQNNSFDFLTTPQVAEILGLAENTLEIWRHRGGIGPKFLKFGRAVRYRRSDLESWINSQTRTSTHQKTKSR